MHELNNLLKPRRTKERDHYSFAPYLFSLDKPKDRQALLAFFKKNAVIEVSDTYHEQVQELFGIHNPSLVFKKNFDELFSAYYEKRMRGRTEWQCGTWVLYPWSGALAHILNDAEFQQVRMARNRNLITEEEQKKFYNSTVGIAGLSVGNSVALAIALQGGCRRMHVADFDTLELSNTNRIRTSIAALGIKKTIMTARQIYEINPYAVVELFEAGITNETIKPFFEGLDIVIDEIDNMAVKLELRKHALKHRIPLVMAADVGDNGIIDVERYDKDPLPDFFHGRLGAVSHKDLESLDKFGIGRTIVKHLEIENIPEKVLYSHDAMGKTLVSWPQLGGTALLNGVAVAYMVRNILINTPNIEDERALINIDEIFGSTYDSELNKIRRKEVIEKYKKIFNIT